MKMSKEQLMAVAKSYIEEFASLSQNAGVVASTGTSKSGVYFSLIIGSETSVAIIIDDLYSGGEKFTLYRSVGKLDIYNKVPSELRDAIKELTVASGFIYEREAFKDSEVYILPDHIVQQKFNSLISDQDTDAVISIF